MPGNCRDPTDLDRDEHQKNREKHKEHGLEPLSGLTQQIYSSIFGKCWDSRKPKHMHRLYRELSLDRGSGPKVQMKDSFGIFKVELLFLNFYWGI
jgi:hypothetical protein